MSIKSKLKKAWHFLWYEDSFASFIANIIVAFIFIKFLVYPGLGLIFGTNLPIVAVVSSSMHHDASFDTWWTNANPWYVNHGISESKFKEFPLRNGFNKGDIMLVSGASVENIELGDIIIFDSSAPNPIIHRVVNVYEEESQTYYQTKGDNYITNPQPLSVGNFNENKISINTIKGKALFRIPYIGYVKILAVDLLGLVK